MKEGCDHRATRVLGRMQTRTPPAFAESLRRHRFAAGPAQEALPTGFNEAIELVERWVGPAREALGAVATGNAWAAGRTMTLERAIAYALADEACDE